MLTLKTELTDVLWMYSMLAMMPLRCTCELWMYSMLAVVPSDSRCTIADVVELWMYRMLAVVPSGLRCTCGLWMPGFGVLMGNACELWMLAMVPLICTCELWMLALSACCKL